MSDEVVRRDVRQGPVAEQLVSGWPGACCELSCLIGRLTSCEMFPNQLSTGSAEWLLIAGGGCLVRRTDSETDDICSV